MACHSEYINFSGDELTIWCVEKKSTLPFTKIVLITWCIFLSFSCVFDWQGGFVFFFFHHLAWMTGLGTILSLICSTPYLFFSRSQPLQIKLTIWKYLICLLECHSNYHFSLTIFLLRGNQWIVLCNRPFIIA